MGKNKPIKFLYSHLPVTARYGAGAYTYQFIAETLDGVYRYEIFADSANDCLYYISQGFGVAIADVDSDGFTWEIFLEGYNDRRFFLYIA